jgi:lipopolysaccharide export system ATP-binding protein
MTVLQTEELVKVYRRRRVVDSVNIVVNQGEIVGLLGPNGAGKTTSFYMIVGIIRPDSGRISIDNSDITRWPMHKRAKFGIGYLAQEPSIFRKMTVSQNIEAILEVVEPEAIKRKERLEELLDELKVSHLADSKAYTLSGGERRRVEIARALAGSPSFILLDEPFSGIDPIAVADIQDLIHELREKKGLGILVTDHNVRETLKSTDRAYIMYKGKILKSGLPADLGADPLVRKIYLGESFEL